MNTTKSIDGMRYEATQAKPIDSKKLSIKMAEQLRTSSLLWLLVKRHKVGLLAIGNILLVLNWAIPMWPQMVISLF